MWASTSLFRELPAVFNTHKCLQVGLFISSRRDDHVEAHLELKAGDFTHLSVHVPCTETK